MDKTIKSKQKRKIKTRRLLRGGKPDFIKIVAYHKDGLLVDYKIVYNNFDNDDQKEYAKIHKVYYPIKGDIMKFNPKKIKIKSQNFFYPSNPLKMNESDFQTIAIHHPDDMTKIKITNQIIQNINGDTTIQNSLQKYDSNNSKLIEEYKKFITTNESIFLNGLSNNDRRILGRKLLNTPVFLNIIGMRYGFIDNELKENLDEIKELMDAPMTTSSLPTGSISSLPTATSSLPTGSTSSLPTATSSTGPTTRRNISNRLRDLIKKSSLKP
jgi:hypothetical protein